MVIKATKKRVFGHACFQNERFPFGRTLAVRKKDD